MAIDVAGWLRQLGLAQYEPAFRDNDVDGDVLQCVSLNGSAMRPASSGRM